MYQILPLIILWGASCILLLGDVFLWKNQKNFTPAFSLLAAVIAGWLTLTRLVDGYFRISFAGSIASDPLAAISALALLVTAALSIMMAWSYLQSRGLEHGEYYVLILLSVSGAMLMASANDLIVLFLGLELLSFALYVLAGFARTQPKSEEASIKYFLLGAFASAFLLYGIALIYGAEQTTNLDVIKNRLISDPSLSGMLLAGTALLLVGLGFKAAVIPFHQWTPDVYEGAPTSVTAYMAGAAKIGAFAAILRVFGALIPLHVYWIPAIEVMAILTMIFGNLLAISQMNVKRMLAYSSIAHAGYLLVAVAAMARPSSGAHDLAVQGALFYLFAYIFMTLGAFGVLIFLSSKEKEFQTIDDLRGLARRSPVAAYSMLFFMLSLGGIPPTMGFMGKWQIFLAALHAGLVNLAIVMALASALAIYYYLRIVWVMCFEEPGKETVKLPSNTFAAMVSVAICTFATILFGVAPDILRSITTLAK
jgi:NADH-quinone oxidoreductase subunit N